MSKEYPLVQLPTKQEDLSRDDGYPPGYTNQIFEDEEIRGYQGLEIDIAITTDTFVPLLMHKYSSKVSPANDYVVLISKHFTEGLPTTREAALAEHVRSSSELAAFTCSLKHDHEGCPWPNLTAPPKVFLAQTLAASIRTVM